MNIIMIMRKINWVPTFISVIDKEFKQNISDIIDRQVGQEAITGFILTSAVPKKGQRKAMSCISDTHLFSEESYSLEYLWSFCKVL